MVAGLGKSIDAVIEACRKVGSVLLELHVEEIDMDAALEGLGTEVKDLHVVLTCFSRCVGTVESQGASVDEYAAVLQALAGAVDDARCYMIAFQGLLDRLHKSVRDAKTTISRFTPTRLRRNKNILVGAGGHIRGHKLNIRVCFSILIAYGHPPPNYLERADLDKTHLCQHHITRPLDHRSVIGRDRHVTAGNGKT
jgi:hypothetical protein